MTTVITPPASAVSFTLQTPVAGDGYGIADITLSWESERRGLANYSIDDVCPGDGKGIYLFAKVWYRDGTNNGNLDYLGGNENGCTGNIYVGQHGLGNSQKRIDYVKFRVCESLGKPSGWNTCGNKQQATSGAFSNPIG